MIFTTQKQREERMAICKSCKHYRTSTNSCGTLLLGEEVTYRKKKVKLCGCVMPLKTQFKTSSCPIEKWHSTVDASALESIREIVEQVNKTRKVNIDEATQLIEVYNKVFGANRDVKKAIGCGGCMKEIIKEFNEVLK
jgi:hypothetical protein